MNYSSTSNPPHRSFWAEQDQGNSSAIASTRNFDSNTIPFPISDGGRLVAPAPNNGSSYQNQDALQQLENNLRIVLKQQQQQNLKKKLQLHHLPQGMVSVSGSEHSHNDTAVNSNTRIQHGEGQCNSDATSGDSMDPSCNEERTNNNINGSNNTSNNSVSKQRERRYKPTPTPNSYSSQFPLVSPSINPSINPTSGGLFTLGDEVQPLSTTSHQKTLRPPSSLLLSSNTLLGSLSEDVTAEEAANDIFMDSIFHAELKLSRRNKSTDTDSKPQPPSTKSDSSQPRQSYPSSKVDQSVEVRIQSPLTLASSVCSEECICVSFEFFFLFQKHSLFQCKLNSPLSSISTHVVSQKQTKRVDPSHDKSESRHRYNFPKLIDDDSNTSKSTQEILPYNQQPKDTMKTKKRKSKDGVSPSKPKQKRKNVSKRKLKFPVLHKDPPIEEQILSLPAIVLAPSLLAKIVTNDPRYQSSVSDAKAGGKSSSSSHSTMNSPTRRRKRSGTTHFATKCNGGDDDDDYEVSPGQTFQNILKARGHNETYSVDVEGTVYDVVPSPLQLASYGNHLVWAIQTTNIALVRKLLGSGLSPNPCNQFRDSILGDLICKQGNVPAYKCFMDEFHADPRVVDGFGRTLLHHCCWAHDLCKPIVEDILRRDPIQMFLRDKQEKTPLDYVRTGARGAWKRFLKDVADKYWPSGKKLPQFPPLVTGRRHPNGDLMDPPKALSPVLAAGVGSGKISPEAVSIMSELSSKSKKKRK